MSTTESPRTPLPVPRPVQRSEEEIAARVAAYEPPPNPDRTGVLAKYAKLVSSAATGAVTQV